jgi:hypothetical protein
MVRMVKAYGRTLLFFVGVSLSWLAGFASGPAVDPVVDREAPLRSVAYSAALLVAWLGLLVGGGWVASSSGTGAVLLVVFVWGFLIAPVVAVVVMRLLFPGISGRLQAQIDEPARPGRARSGTR